MLPDNDAFDNFEVEHDFQDLGHRTMVLNARRVDHMQLILLAIEDLTAAPRTDRALRESEGRLTSIMQHAPIGIGLIDQEGQWVLQNPLLESLSSGRARGVPFALATGYNRHQLPEAAFRDALRLGKPLDRHSEAKRIS